MEQAQVSYPGPRKQLDNRSTYPSRFMPVTEGEPFLSDLGLALLGRETYSGHIMPTANRAPEVMLDMEWDNKVDIWAAGMTTCSLFERGHSFENNPLETDFDHAQRFVEIIFQLGPPLLEFLEGVRKASSSGMSMATGEAL